MVISIVLVLSIFALDVITPRGYAEGMLYGIPVLLTLWVPQKYSPLSLAVVCTIMSVIGFFFSPEGAEFSQALSNRGLTILNIAAIAGLCLLVKKEKQLLHQANTELEYRVQERTKELSEANVQLRQEIADRQLAQQHLSLSNGKLEQFAYVASHDMQEPLRMVETFLDLLHKRYEPQLNSKGKEFIDYAREGAIRMRQMVNGLLDLARIQTKGRAFASVNGADVVNQALAHLKVAIAESGAVITHDDLPNLHGDEVQLLQLFQNLIGNAIKYRGDKVPVIHIGAEQREGEFLFSIRDNGIGIDPRFSDRIFVLFQRLHTYQEYPGTGIGLAICKGIVERHGGKIWVESRPGQGATFYFTIPDKLAVENRIK